MESFGLKQEHIDFLKNTFKNYIKDESAKIYIFGSRAKGNYKKFSDVDIAVDCQSFDDDLRAKIQLAFENSLFPYEVDIVDLNNIKKSFMDLIKDSMVELK